MPSSLQINHLPLSLQRLICAIDALSSIDSLALLRALRESNVEADDLSPWADYSHPLKDSYGRKLVFHGGFFELMVMTWLPGDFSAIHDHGLAQWGAVQCFGAAEHDTFTLRGRHLSHDSSLPYAPGQIRIVNSGLIHQMGNAGSQSFLSLHIYGADAGREEITGNARVFDVDQGCIQFTNGGVFFNLPDREILRSQIGLTAEPSLVRRQRELKMWRATQALAEAS